MFDRDESRNRLPTLARSVVNRLRGLVSGPEAGCSHAASVRERIAAVGPDARRAATACLRVRLERF